MLELPEAVTLAFQMKEAYGGKVITRAVAGYTPHKFAFYEGDPADYSSRLEGKTVGGSASFGGHAMMIAGDMQLVGIHSAIKKAHRGGRTPAQGRRGGRGCPVYRRAVG